MKRLVAKAIIAISDVSLLGIVLAVLSLWEHEWFYFGLSVVMLGFGIFLEPWARRVLSD